jgi:hypothetical protein
MNDPQSSPKIFKFKGLLPALTALTLVVLACLVSAVAILATGGASSSVVFFIGITVFFVFLGLIFLVSKSDLVIDDSGISRSLAGKQIQNIPWKCVQRVTTYPVRGAGVRRGVTAYNIFASSSARSDTRTRKIYFSDQSVDIVGLIDAMNVYITKYQIKVERLADGRTTSQKSL